MGSLAVSRLAIDETLPSASIADQVAAIARKELAPQALAIDEGTLYPDALLRRLGEAGAWGSHQPENGAADLRCAIQSIAASARSAAPPPSWRGARTRWSGTPRIRAIQQLVAKFADKFASGEILGGTGLSNPMKSFFGIEKLKLKGRKVEGGYVVRGALPWVSNLGADHFFGTIFEREDAPGGGTAKGGPDIVMFLADCANPAITLQPCKPFLAMDGTGTYGVQFRDVFVPDELILAEPAGPFVKKIRAGFILLQAGMALGLIKDCIQIMDEVEAPLGHVNRYLPQQPAAVPRTPCRIREGDDGAGARSLQCRRQLLAARRGASAARRRRQRRGRACGDAPLRRARLPEEPSRAAPASRSLFRRHRHPRHQAASQDAGRRRALEGFPFRPNQQPQNRRGLP